MTSSPVAAVRTPLRFVWLCCATWLTLFKSSWHSASGSIAVSGLMLAFSALAGRALGSSAYGKIVAVAAYYTWFTLLGSYATYAALPGEVAAGNLTQAARTRIFGTAVVMSALFTGLAAFLALLALPHVAGSFGIGALTALARLYVIAFALHVFRYMVDMVNQTCGWLRQWSASSIIAAGLPVALLLGFKLTGNQLGLGSYVLLLIAAYGASTVFTISLFVWSAGGWKRLRPDWSVTGRMLKAGRGPLVALMGNILSVSGTKALLAANLPSRQLGLFEAALMLTMWVSSIALSVTIPAMSEWSAMAASGDISHLRHDFRRKQAATAAVMGIACVVSLIWAEPILRLFYGSDYIDAALVLRCITATWLLGGIGGWYMYFFIGCGHPWRVGLPNLISAIGGFGLALALVHYTKLGAAIGALALVGQSVIWLAMYEWNFRRAVAAG